MSITVILYHIIIYHVIYIYIYIYITGWWFGTFFPNQIGDDDPI